MQTTLDLDTPEAVSAADLATLRRHGWRVVGTRVVNGARCWLLAHRSQRQMCGHRQFVPLPPLMKTAEGVAAMCSLLENRGGL